METFRKGSAEPASTSATVAHVGRSALRLAAASLLACGGLACSVLAAGPAFGLSVSGPAATSTGATTATVPVTSAAQAVLIVFGHGWGHGLGMGQWGAYGYALHGWRHDQILAHYYPGTALGHTPARTVRVLLASARKVTVGSEVPWTVTDATGRQATLDPGELAFKGSLALAAQPALQPPFTFSAPRPLLVNGATYRGKLVVSVDGKLVQVVDVVGLEQYLRGVVPAEVPKEWPAEALQAQAVASRSYALANLEQGRAFDFYGDTRSQAYAGASGEAPETSAAVAATKGEVVLYHGKVADTLYFSTSGGRTASALDSIGLDAPYLVPVSDPYDTLSPYHDWGPVALDAAKVAKALKLSAPLADLQATPGVSGRVRTVTVSSDDESQVVLTGDQVRAALGLRSNWFTTAFLQLLPAARTMTYGGAVSLSGAAHGVASLSLEAKTAAAPGWAPAGPLALGPAGSFTTVVKPQATTQYRLAWGRVRAGLVRIGVAPRVDAVANAGVVTGSISPVIAGAAVQLQQQSGAAWTTLAATVTDAAGAWSFPGALTAGTYRIRCAPGQGLVPGSSATLLLQ
jgi:stage II sporulation protein D